MYTYSVIRPKENLQRQDKRKMDINNRLKTEIRRKTKFRLARGGYVKSYKLGGSNLIN